MAGKAKVKGRRGEEKVEGVTEEGEEGMGELHNMLPPLSSLCGRLAAEPTAPTECRRQRSSRFPRPIRCHAHRCSCLTR